tara:strand:+ start:355 stop:2175 length:1821 start_codon:yes stop_codon:yes gene_type:complete
MKLVTFKQLSLRNFLSVGNEPVRINFRRGLNVITGINKDKQDRRNGVGKSTIADALHFALFGSTIRDLKKEHIVNNITQKDCEVVLEFTITNNNISTKYKLVRRLVPSKCFLYENDIDITRDSISNTTTYITSLINSTPEVFQNCVIMTVNNTTPFMAKKKIEKRKFVEGILNLEVFSDMLCQVRNEYNSVTKEFDIECMRYEEVSKTIETYESQIIQHKNNISSTNSKYNLQLQENSREINRLDEQLAKIRDDIKIDHADTITEYEKKLTTCDLRIHEKIVGLAQHKTELKFLNDAKKRLSVDSEECPMCLRSITPDDKQHIDFERARIDESILQTSTAINEYDDGELKKLKSLLENKIKDLCYEQQEKATSKLREESIESERDKMYKWDDQLKSSLASEDIIGRDLKKSTTNSINRLTEIQKNIDRVKDELNRLDIIKFIVSEEGVKSYIVKKILQVLNNKLAYYLKRMDANCICVFNEYFEEQIFDEKGKICSYFNFSGAERKNIDLACLFAFMDIRRLQGDVVFDFNMYDELLDSSLDERGIEIVIDILKERVSKFGEMIYIISHRKEAGMLVNTSQKGDLDGEVIVLEKQKGITTRVALPC